MKLASCFSSCILAACAAQAPPVPPRIEKPAKITDLAVTQIGRTFELSFTPPVLAADGERLSKPIEIDIYRSAEVRGRLPSISADEAPWVTLKPEEWMPLLRTQKLASSSSAPGVREDGAYTRVRGPGRGLKPSSTREGGQETTRTGAAGLIRRRRKPKSRAHEDHASEGSLAIYQAALSQQEFDRSIGTTLAFAVRALTRGFRGRPIEADLSNIVSATLLDVSVPVQGVSVAEPTEHTIELRWAAPARSLTGGQPSQLAGYRVYKSATGKPGWFAPIADVTDTRYEDHDFQFGQTYYYKLRAVFKKGRQAAESEDSALVQFTPRDIFPPSAPSELAGMYTDGAVELIWNPNREEDLAGYNVYRRVDSGPPQRINSALLSTPAFRDNSTERGHTYDYWVTAVDEAQNESPASHSVRVETR